MLKIKFLILLSSTLLLISCGMKIEQNIFDKDNKYSLRYFSGGQNVFNYGNILKQQLIANNLYSSKANNEIVVSLGEEREYLTTSITKVASRESSRLTIQVQVYDQAKSNCILFDENYVSEQTYSVSGSSANLSNRAARDDVFLINSENISHRIVDDLLFQTNENCIINE